ncbi:MAG: protein-disulfide reductase DsbD N-terminal domain-containing protein [Gemmataceae bacterium]|nr:protein-disulfide reductase DsbD N-terminal domain-containing protein [Gemmataceae bacterium]MDW8267480.1 protein-disulfide reductase DsbD N-terminal domain-containing protein [Gemmataceae bacterium]
MVRRRTLRWSVLLLAGMVAVAAAGPRKSEAVVKVTARAMPETPGPDGTQVVIVTLSIEKGWHIYANPVGNETLASTATVVAIDHTPKPEVTIDYPAGKLVKDKDVGDYRTYEGTVQIKATVKRSPNDAKPLTVRVRFHACDDKGCLPPGEVTLMVP